MKLSILVPALESRKTLHERVLPPLEKQVKGFPGVELLVDMDNGEVTSGVKRNRLIKASKGDYFAFVDDDDMVSDDYIDQLLYAMGRTPDVVTFRLYREARHETFIFLANFLDRIRIDQNTYIYTPNPVCCWRRDIGTSIAFQPMLGFNDDCFWYKPLLFSGLIKTESHIASILYYYMYNSIITVNQQKERRTIAKTWAGMGIEFFLVGNKIYSAMDSIDAIKNHQYISVLCNDATVRWIDRKVLGNPFLILRIA